MSKEVIGGVVGTSISVVGTGIQTNELLQTISLVLTILGTIITIAMALVNWYKNAKSDGKITKEEIDEGIEIITNGAKDVKDKIEQGKDK